VRVVEVRLNYGRLVLRDSYCDISYSAPGYGVDLVNVHRSYLRDIAGQIESVARSNISYLDRYISFIDAGYSVCKCVEAEFMVQPTPEQCIEACETFQGGYVKHYTREDIESMKERYLKMLDDAETIKGYSEIVEERRVEITPVEGVVAVYYPYEYPELGVEYPVEAYPAPRLAVEPVPAPEAVAPRVVERRLVDYVKRYWWVALVIVLLVLVAKVAKR